MVSPRISPSIAATSAPSAAGLEMCRASLHGASDRGVPAVDQEGNAPLREARAKQRAIAIAEGVVEDGAGKPVMLHEDERVLERVGGGERSAGGFELPA